MTGLTTVAERICRGRRLLAAAAALWAGAVGLLALALVLGCPAEVFEGGLGGALGTALASAGAGAGAPQGVSLWHAWHVSS